MAVRQFVALNCKTSLETGRKEELLSHCGRGMIA